LHEFGEYSIKVTKESYKMIYSLISFSFAKKLAFGGIAGIIGTTA
jgi:hypothetical protein